MHGVFNRSIFALFSKAGDFSIFAFDLVKECTAEERAAAVTKPPRPASPAQIALAAQVLQGLRNPAATAAGPGGSPPAEPSVPEERQSGPQLPQLRSVYVLHADKNGLPISNDPRPSWLIKADELVLDARKQASGGILMIQPVLMDASGDWGKKKQDRPRWLRAILATNRNHARLWGHAMIIRWQPTMPQLTGWQKAQCGRKTTEKVCTKNNERENFNWEKHLMLQEYLQSPQKFEFVLMLDADAAIVKHRVNVLGQIATRMKADGLDVFLTNEDWLQNGERRINGGLIMSKNTVWTNDLFTAPCLQSSFSPVAACASLIGLRGQQCSSNEQICLNDVLWGPGKELVKNRMLLVSGVRYNRGGCTVRHCGEPISDQTMETLKMKDERLEVLHFMGGSKGLAPEALCDGEVDYTGDGPDGYGCKEK
ncbi:unnamed protein product [Polarella glacialis]|uniref:Uncharacterized protein n=1 Tax=Polarella glacialis TaxID=89957 RepID=A0A813FX66_POLGL|nr:unnamed protein product [Polarella glacialis]